MLNFSFVKRYCNFKQKLFFSLYFELSPYPDISWTEVWNELNNITVKCVLEAFVKHSCWLVYSLTSRGRHGFLSFASTTLQFLQQVSSVDQFRWQVPLHPGAPAGCTCKTSDALFTSALTVSDKCRLHVSYLQIEVKTLLIFHHWDSLL